MNMSDDDRDADLEQTFPASDPPPAQPGTDGPSVDEEPGRVPPAEPGANQEQESAEVSRELDEDQNADGPSAA